MADITYCSTCPPCGVVECFRHHSKADQLPFPNSTSWADFSASCPDYTPAKQEKQDNE